MVNFLPIVKTLESTNISVRGLGQVVVDPATIEVGNNSVVARCRVAGTRGFKTIKCYRTTHYRDDIKGVDYYPQSLKVYGFNGRVVYVDIAISMRTMIHDHPDTPIHPNDTFIPKKLAMRVGGISISDTRVNTFIILF